MITFDHLRLVRRQPTEVARYRRLVLGAQPGKMSELAIEHENDGSCCRKEPWNVTAASITLAINAPTPMVLMNLNRPEIFP